MEEKNKNNSNLLSGYISGKINEVNWNIRQKTRNTTYYLFNTSQRTLPDNNYSEILNKTSKTIDYKNNTGKDNFKMQVKIWMVIYIIIAIPLWCVKGWCCCCLFCKFFKPNKTIEEAKKFLESNPPGVYHHRGTLIYYEPTDNEKQCYERFEHLIRTI